VPDAYWLAMARVNYQGFDLPDGNEIPDVPADLTTLVDSIIAEMAPRSWTMTRASPANTDMAVNALLLSLPFNVPANGGGVLLARGATTSAPWNVNSSGAVNLWMTLENPPGTVTVNLQGQSHATGWTLSAAVTPRVDKAHATFEYAFDLASGIGDCVLKLWGVANTAGGYPVGSKMDWQRCTITAQLFKHAALVTRV
jgi:hypothetical protein